MTVDELNSIKDSNKRLKVSVIMPNYNGAKYIEEAVNSVLEQTLDEIEVIVIDDCSTDNSVEILQKIQTKYPSKVRIIQNEVNLGAGLSRNAGIDIAKGEFIKFLDSDDTMDKDVLENMYNIATENNVKAVLGVVSIMQRRNKKHDNYNVNNNYEVIDIRENKEDLIYGSAGIGDGIFDKGIFDRIRFPKLKWEDLATIPALRVEAGKIYYIDKSVYNYRIYEESTTGIDMCKKTPRVFDIVQCLNKMREEIPKEYEAELDAVQYMQYRLRMKEIASWEDCSEEHKKVLINSLNKLTKIQIPDLDRNPYVKIIQSRGKVSLEELRNGDYIQIGILDKEETFKNIQKRTEKYYQYMNKYRKKDGIKMSSYLDTKSLEREESIEDILSNAKESDLNEQGLEILQRFEELINDSNNRREDIIRKSLVMTQNLISNKGLMQKDKTKIITSMYKILAKSMPDLNEIMQNVEEQLIYSNNDITMYLDEDFIQSNSIEEILANVQELLTSKEFLTYSMHRGIMANSPYKITYEESIKADEYEKRKCKKGFIHKGGKIIE